MDAQTSSDETADLRVTPPSGRPWYGIIGLVAVVALAVAAWRGRLRRRSAQVAAEEARMEPKPVVY